MTSHPTIPASSSLPFFVFDFSPTRTMETEPLAQKPEVKTILEVFRRVRVKTRTSYNYPAGTVMPERCFYCQGLLEPEDDESGRCEICRMPWGPSSSAPSVDDFTVALPPEAGQMIEDNFAALALPNPIQ